MANKTILVIKLGALGDFVQGLGPMAAIKKNHVNDDVILLTTKPYEKLAQLSGYFDRIICDERPKWFEPLKWIKLSKTLNILNVTRVYDLQNNDRTGFYFKLFKIKPEWVGIAKGASHQNTSPDRSIGKAYDGHVQTLALAGIKDIGIDDFDWMKSEKTFNGLKNPYVLIIAGASPKHVHKRWPSHHYGTLCQMLVQKGYQPVLIGTESEININDHIQKIEPNCLNLTGKTDLFDLPMLARNAIAAIGNDTGPMHFIGPTGCVTIVIFGAKTNPKKHGPLGHKVTFIQDKNLEDIAPLKVMNLFLKQTN